jgi:hypothetical protein
MKKYQVYVRSENGEGEERSLGEWDGKSVKEIRADELQEGDVVSIEPANGNAQAQESY